jgi:hypothetical protein
VRARARVLTAVALAALAVTAAGCKRGGAASCDAVGARFLALAHQDLDATADLDAASRRGLSGLLAPMRDSMVRACREDRWAVDARTCFIGATDVAALRACEATLTAPQRELLRAAAGKGIQAPR